MSKPTYTIAVTGLNNIDSPGPGIPVIRGLKESEAFDVRIIGLSYENLEPGIYMPEKFGVRLEEIVILTDNGPAILSKISRELKVINP